MQGRFYLYNLKPCRQHFYGTKPQGRIWPPGKKTSQPVLEAYPYLTSFSMQTRTFQEGPRADSSTTPIQVYVKLRRTVRPVGGKMFSARLLTSNPVLEFLSSPGPLALYRFYRKSRLKREDFESGLSRLGSEDRIFWILPPGLSQNLRYVTSTNPPRFNPNSSFSRSRN